MLSTIAFAMPGPMELLLTFLIIFLLFGAKRLPEIASSLKKAINEFKKGKNEENNDKPEKNIKI